MPHAVNVSVGVQGNGMAGDAVEPGAAVGAATLAWVARLVRGAVLQRRVRGAGAAEVCILLSRVLRDGLGALRGASSRELESMVELLCGEMRMLADGEVPDVAGVGALLAAVGVRPLDFGASRGAACIAVVGGSGSKTAYTVGELVESAMGGGMLPLSRAQYVALLRAGVAAQDGCVTAVRVTLRRTVRGEWTTAAGRSQGREFLLTELPVGQYVLSGNVQRRVSRDQFAVYLAHVHVFPFVYEKGACYLRTLDVCARFRAYVALGLDPVGDEVQGFGSAHRLVRSCVCVTDGGCEESDGCVHVGCVRSLPVLPVGVRVGGRPGDGRALSRSDTHIRRAVDNALAGLASKARGTTEAVPPVPALPSAAGVGLSQTVGALGGALAALSTARDVSTWMSDLGVDAGDEASARVEAWEKHMHVEGYVTRDEARALSTGRFGWPPASRGVRVVLSNTPASSDATMLTWKRRSSRLPGWNFEVARVKRGVRVIAVPPASAVYGRYQFFVPGGVELGGGVRVTATHAVVWSCYPVTLLAVAGNGEVWRAWCESGSCGLADVAVKRNVLDNDKVIHTLVPVPVNDVRVVTFDGVSLTAGGEPTAVTNLTAVQPLQVVLLSCPTSAFTGAPVRVVVSGSALTFVEVGGAHLTALGGTVEWVSLGLSHPLRLRQRMEGVVRFAVTACLDVQTPAV